jgi:putative transposase
MDWKMLLACITGSVDEELLLRNKYLVTENRILRKQIEGRVILTDTERQTLAEIGMTLLLDSGSYAAIWPKAFNST